MEAEGGAPVEAAGASAAEACRADDPVPCLLHAWALARDPVDNGWLPAADVHSNEARRALSPACDGGLSRACVDLGWTEQVAMGTYARVDEARARWTQLCEGGEGAACRALLDTAGAKLPDVPLDRALELQDPLSAVLAVGHRPDDVVLRALEAACAASVAEACGGSQRSTTQTAGHLDGSSR